MKFKFIKTKYDANAFGYFGEYGGRYVPEVLHDPLTELTLAYEEAKVDSKFAAEIQAEFKTYVGRPTPLYHCSQLSKNLGGAQIYVKNEGQALTGAHKINHCIGQVLLARRMGKKRIVAETGAGQHGLAAATVAARFNMPCTIYMGEVDHNRQRPNVCMMERLGAKVVPVTDGTRRLKDAATAAMKHWIAHSNDTYFLLGSVIGPHPFPTIVKDFQTIIGLEVQEQLRVIYKIDKPNYCIACVGGGSNALGLFNPYLEDTSVKLIGVEAGGKDITSVGQHASKISGGGRIGIVEGFKSLFLQNEDGQLSKTHCITAGIDYSGIGPQHAHLNSIKRVEYVNISDQEAFNALDLLAKQEGLIPALESAHAVAEAVKRAPGLSTNTIIVVNLSGRGEKDLFITAPQADREKWIDYLKSQLTVLTS